MQEVDRIVDKLNMTREEFLHKQYLPEFIVEELIRVNTNMSPRCPCD